jgi:hypothetical protein
MLTVGDSSSPFLRSGHFCFARQAALGDFQRRKSLSQPDSSSNIFLSNQKLRIFSVHFD